MKLAISFNQSQQQVSDFTMMEAMITGRSRLAETISSRLKQSTVDEPRTSSDSSPENQRGHEAAD